MHPNCNRMFIKHVIPLLRPTDFVLEIGPEWIPSTSQKEAAGRYSLWHTADIGQVDAQQTYVCDEEALPMPDCFYDVVFSTQVIEHVRRPWIWLKELACVVKADGYLITICPVSWPHHECPLDCWRIYPDGMRALYAEAGIQQCVSVFESDADGVTDTIAIGHKPRAL